MQTKFFFIFWIAFFSLNALGQTFSGKYEGTAEIIPFGKLPIKAEIREKERKISGSFETPLGVASIISGSFEKSTLLLVIDSGGDDIYFQGDLADGKLKGTVKGEILKGTFELTRVGEASPEPDLSYLLSQSKAKWREDLRFLAETIISKHKNAFHTVSRQQFENAVNELERKISALNDSQIILEMAKLTAMIGDGHSQFIWDWAYSPLKTKFFLFEKEVRVIETDKKFSRINGAKLVKIDGVSIEEIFKRSQPFISQGETPQFVFSRQVMFLRYPFFLYAIGVAKKTDSAVYEFVDVNGRTFSAKLKILPENETKESIYPYKKTPQWLENTDKPLFFTHLTNSEAVYVRFTSYPRRAEFKKFSEELFAFLDKTPIKKLIIDMRHNGGGDFTRGRDFFVKQLKERRKLTEKGKFFVIVGRQTFSAGMSNAADFRNEFEAILVGEPTGQKPNGYSENRFFRLPNSRLEFTVSIDFYKFTEEDTLGLIPDKIIKPDWKSFQNGRDLALEWILNY